MVYKGYRVWVVAVALVVTLGILLGGQYLFRRERVDRPLLEQYKEISAVESASIRDEQGRKVIELQLGEVDDLAKSYRDIEAASRNFLEKDSYRLVIVDKRDRGLEDVYYRMHFSLEEAIATGRFTDMADRVGTIAGSSDLDRYRLSVDGQRLYLQLHRGDRYLYAVLERSISDGSEGKRA